MKATRDYIKDMLDYLDTIQAFTSAGREAFLSDRKTQFAVIRAYEVIGEIAKRLSPELQEANPEIDWSKLINFRDFLADNYERIIVNNIWAAVEDLPRLRAQVAAILMSLLEDDEA